MDSHGVILRIDHCLRMYRSNDGTRRRNELFQICRENLHLTGDELFNAFRGHLDMVSLRTLVSAWDTWRALLSIKRGRPTRKRPRRFASSDRRRELVPA